VTDARGHTWHVLDRGTPRDGTLVCVHGNPTWSYLWRRFLASAPPGWRVVAVDQLGMGFSERRAVPRTLADRVADLDAVPAPDPAGWVTVSLTRLAFPARCCVCEEVTAQTLHVTVDAGWDQLVGPVVQQTRQAGLDVPLCESCRDALRERQARGGSLGLRLGALLGAGAAALYALARGAGDVGTLLLFGLAGVAAGGIVGFVAGTSLARELPVQVRGYSPAHGTLSIRFRNPAYTARVLEAMRK
jgi:hypothetical protein